MFSLILVKTIANTITQRHHFLPMRLESITRLFSKQILSYTLVRIRIATTLEDENLAIVHKITNAISFDPLVLILGIYNKGTPLTMKKYISTKQFIESLFIIAKY
jgi:uncharacterized protein YpbB